MAVMAAELSHRLEVRHDLGRILRIVRQRMRQPRRQLAGGNRGIDGQLRLLREITQRPIERGLAKLFALGRCQVDAGLAHGFAAKCAITASAVLPPTTRASTSRVARRTPEMLPNAVNKV